jgi:Flp pilus assembly protein TadG
MAEARCPAPPGRRHEEGSVIILVTVSIVALLCFALLAIDGSIMMTTKTQLQNAADAAALAGASGLGEGGSQALATERAINTAAQNDAVRETRVPVVITESDVTFPTYTRIGRPRPAIP